MKALLVCLLLQMVQLLSALASSVSPVRPVSGASMCPGYAMSGTNTVSVMQ